MNLKFRRKDTPPEFPDVVTWAAWLYYIDQMTQIDVAKVLGVSRASVVNYLQEARESGLVPIHFDQIYFRNCNFQIDPKKIRTYWLFGNSKDSREIKFIWDTRCCGCKGSIQHFEIQ